MAQNISDRREFLKIAFIAAAAFPVLTGCRVSTLAQKSESKLDLIKKNARARGVEGMGAIDVPDDVTWKAVIAAEKDEGEPMIISGTVFQSDGKTPAPSVLIYFYHTDMYGIYGRKGEHKHGKFRGWMLTDELGRYEFRSIRPASYPNSTFAAHVHMTITTAEREEDWIDSILFEGDRFLTAKERIPQRGGFNPVVDLKKGADGILRAVRNIQLS